MLSEHFSLDVDVEVIIDEEILGGLVGTNGIENDRYFASNPFKIN